MNAIDLYYALEYGGVDNWEGFDIAVGYAEEDGFNWADLDEESRLDYLVSAGVDNWHFYDESIERYKKEHMEG